MFSRFSYRLASTAQRTYSTVAKPTVASKFNKTQLLFSSLAVVAAVSTTAYYVHNNTNSLSLINNAYADSAAKQPETDDASGRQGLSPKEFRKFRVKEIKPYNYNSNIIVFDVEDPNKPLNLPCASFILTQAEIDGKAVSRPYTPIDQNQPGVLNLLVKKYETGAMSKYLHTLKQGDTLEIKGPLPKIKYEPGAYQNIGMIAGGSGITPMAQVIEEVTRNPNDKTKVTLLFANIGPKDILLREKFDAIAKKNQDRFRAIYLVEKDAEQGMIQGRINKDILKRYLPPPEQGNQILVCGPMGMMEAISGGKAKDYTQGELKGLLAELGYTKDNVYKF